MFLWRGVYLNEKKETSQVSAEGRVGGGEGFFSEVEG